MSVVVRSLFYNICASSIFCYSSQNDILWHWLQQICGGQYIPEVPDHCEVHHENSGQHCWDNHLHLFGHLSCGQIQMGLGHWTCCQHSHLYLTLSGNGWEIALFYSILFWFSWSLLSVLKCTVKILCNNENYEKHIIHFY